MVCCFLRISLRFAQFRLVAAFLLYDFSGWKRLGATICSLRGHGKRECSISNSLAGRRHPRNVRCHPACRWFRIWYGHSERLSSVATFVWTIDWFPNSVTIRITLALVTRSWIKSNQLRPTSPTWHQLATMNTHSTVYQQGFRSSRLYV